jgi:hypothetical protein
MARAKAVLPPPSGEQVSGALEALKARIIAELAKIPGLVPGSEPWVAALERRLNNAFDGSFVLALKTELLVEIPKLVLGGKGPVSTQDVDLA